MDSERPYDKLKRSLDVMASVSGLVVLAPLLLIVALLVWLRLGSPVLFRQSRPGLNGEVFELMKFRTMLEIDEAAGVVTNEQRMTDFGRVLRATSLDELPSLLNILRGDMSLVGPRPLLVKYLPLYSARQRRRHEVRPGLTGLAQVSGRNALEWERRFELDVHYVENRSLSLDVRILLQTVWKVIRRDGISTDGHPVGAPFQGSRQAGEQ